MKEWLFEPASIFVLALSLLNLAVLGYLLSVRAKSVATKWLAGAFVGLFLLPFYALLTSSLFVIPEPYWLSSSVLGFGSMGVFFWAYLQFAFHFLERPFPRESTAALAISTALLLGICALMGYGDATGNVGDGVGPLAIMVFLGFFLWTTVVFLRKWFRSARQTPSGHASPAVRAFRAFALINVWFLLCCLLVMVGRGTLGLIGINGFFFGIVLVYLNFASEPTSFQAKLIGLSLVAVLGPLVGVWIFFDFSHQDFVTEAPQQQALRFAPDTLGQGGYRVAALDFQFDAELGDQLDLDDDSARSMPLGFSFPFYDEEWDQLYVSANGVVTFGEPIYRDEHAFARSRYFYNDLPKIAPLYVALDPTAEGGVYFRQADDRAVVTWHEIPRHDEQTTNTVQLVLLDQDGAIDFVYQQVDSLLTKGQRGLMPGRPPVVFSSLAADMPYTIPAGTARIENYEVAYRRRLDTKVMPLIWLVLGAVGFVLVVFPFVFRGSLVKPIAQVLRGVQRVNAGDLTTEVPVGARDEIGRLTHHFNRMTASLRRYNSEMEALVAERTIQLEQSLNELKTTQAQLIQQEKMASLGQLTAGIAHEIKNPLNFVTNFAALSQGLVDELEEETDPEEVQAILADLKLNAAKIEEHGQRADGIVRSMMQHARAGSGAREAVDLNALVSEHIALAYHGKRAQLPDFNAEIEKDLRADVGRVEVVPQDIGRVLLNLIGNAFDAVREQSLSVNGQYAPTVNVSTRRVGDQVEIRVADNGPGIAPDVKAKIFEPFFTTKPTGSGTGLGLSLSYDIVTQGHGGMLTVESELSEGATFVVRLPETQAG